MRIHAARARGLAARIGLAALLTASPARAAGPPIFVETRAGVDALTAKRVRDVVAARRSIRDEAPPPPPSSVSPERAAMAERAASIKLALDRALRLESEASWNDCVREAAGALGDAVLVLAKVGDLALLRDLHVQIGACLTLSDSAANARPHFIAAALLDEAQPKLGLHREEAEKAQAEARAEVLARSRGKVTIETDPPGADLWIDGRKIEGKTPLTVDVRLGDHYLTLRRFRYEPHTERAVLQPPAVLRITLDPARRDALREQLAALSAGSLAAPPEPEALFARAVWSHAEQVITIEPAPREAAHISLFDAPTGKRIREAIVRNADDDAAVRRAVCGALGETCEVKSGGVPWYIWPIAGAAVISGVVAAALIADANREYRFCPSGGCR